LTPEVRVIGITGIPEVHPGDDLAGLILHAANRQETPPVDGDVLVVTQKVVSKAEGRVVVLSTVEPSSFARRIAEETGKNARHVEVVLRESRRIVRMDRGVIITETHHGFICANAGVDASNAGGPGLLTLLPEDPDASAEGLRRAIEERAGARVAVVITDTFGRPWREGTDEVAIGVAGLVVLKDYAGQRDPYGYELRVTQVAVADELAGASELVTGKLERIPAALIRGYRFEPGAGHGRDLVRDPDRDLFR
jgi:coenzyme F420-0:L-glutamate ligase/coenzyme F420-1:gamma-L-glutamate ligase